MTSFDIAMLIAQWYCIEGYDLRGNPLKELREQLSHFAGAPDVPDMAQLACKMALLWLAHQDDEFYADVRGWLEADDLFDEEGDR